MAAWKKQKKADYEAELAIRAQAKKDRMEAAFQAYESAEAERVQDMMLWCRNG